ncbi:hypothetical protein VTO73DRAFT_5979 [Trametes versicolor]
MRTIFVVQAGPMNVTPSDWVVQSFPFSYVSVETTSMDGHAHEVQVYSEISGGWLSGDQDSTIQWIEYSTANTVIHNVQLQSPQKYVEINQQAQDGQAYFAMTSRPGLTWQITRDITCRGLFHDTGALNGSRSLAFRKIDLDVPVFAIAVDLGKIQSISTPVTWAVGYVRNPSIGYTAPVGTTQDLMPYYTTRYPGVNISVAIDDFASAFPDIQQKAIALDNAILRDASRISGQYADLVSLAARQMFGSLDITVSAGTDGKPNASDTRIFMKDIAISASTGHVNPVEKIYAALPMLLYFNASLVGPLLSPLLDAQDGSAGEAYAAQDIGLAYPKATGTRGAHNQGVEQTGNMLVMLYAHARFSGDGTLIHKHLVNNSLSPSDQLSADTEIQNSANMTNLALKGLIGVKAMSEISRALGQQDDAKLYHGHATALAASWESLALSSDGTRLLGVYGNEQTWALMYNIYADRLLDTGIILQSQTAFYKTLLNSSAPKFGLPIASNASGISNTAWLLFTTGTVLDDDVRDGLINGVWTRASFNQTTGPFPDAYDSATGAIQGGSNTNAGSPFGAMFSLLALNVPNVTIAAPSILNERAHSGNGGRKVSMAIIAGAVAAGVTSLVIVGLGVWFIQRQRHRHNLVLARQKAETPPPGHLSPYFIARTPHPKRRPSSTTSSSSHVSISESLEVIGSDSSLVPSSAASVAVAQNRRERKHPVRATSLRRLPGSGSTNVVPPGLSELVH